MSTRKLIIAALVTLAAIIVANAVFFVVAARN
jgi:hypothetical protein